MARATKADGVLHYSLSFCQTYAAEALRWRRRCRKKGFPCSRWSPISRGMTSRRLLTRVQAFVEMLVRAREP